jgi:nucleotide-binding universal stress UspA family protein
LEELQTFLLEEHALDHAIERARTHGVRVTTAAVNAAGRQTADVITAEAVVSGADLIAMGTHGRRGIQRTLLGSVAEGVARSATVPVLLIRGRSKSVL